MPNQRERLAVPPADLLLRLPDIGRLMITAKQGGATHERIGSVARAERRGDAVVLSGDEHASTIALGGIASVIVDRTSVMRDQAYPRADFLDAEDDVLFSVVGFGGIEPFDAVLARFGPGEALPVRTDESGPRGEVIEGDPGAAPFEAALKLAAPVTIGFARPGFEQAWHGLVEGVKPAMGFINVMRPDFHLHLKSGAVAHWRAEPAGDEVVLHAERADGAPIGLFVRGPAILAADAAS